MIDVAFTDVVVNASPALALSRGVCSVMVWVGISHGAEPQLIFIAANLTAVRYRNEVLRPTAVRLALASIDFTA